MNTTITTTTNNALVAAHIQAITIKTGSALMGTSKALLIEEAKRQMRNGVCHFIYLKKNGAVREAFGTLDASLISRYINGNGCSRECFATTAYFDCQKAAWRSFRWENLVAIL